MDSQSNGFAYVSVVNWMRARHLILQGQMDYAMMYLDRVGRYVNCASEFWSYMSTQTHLKPISVLSSQTSKFLTLKVNSIQGPTTVKLVNCKVDNLITLGM